MERTLINKTFLFRMDGAQENEAFLQAAASKGHVVYAGISLTLMRGWIPDFVEVVPAGEGVCTVTLIELEATETLAVVGARKYLPERPDAILSAFLNYLDRVLARCRSSADPRLADFQALRDGLGVGAHVIVKTAAALRQPPQIVETLPLLDQGAIQHTVASPSLTAEESIPSLTGEVLLSPRQHKSLSRTVLVLDAVVRGWDKSDASLRAWRNLRRQPLRLHIKERSADFPALTSLLFGSKTGVGLLVDDVAHELCVIWSQFEPRRHSVASVLNAIRTFWPINETLDPRASVRIAFSKARESMDGHAALTPR